MIKVDLNVVFFDVAEKVEELATPIAESLGLEVIYVEFITEKGRHILRVYIDKAIAGGTEEEEGVNVGDCGRLSNELSTVLDVEDCIAENYYLEVTSPGINRPLKKEKHFALAIGEKIKIKTKEAVDGRKNFKVTLEGVSDKNLFVRDSTDEKITIKIDNVEKANIDY